MLRITVEPELDRIRLKLEGDLSGPWVAEVEESATGQYLRQVLPAREPAAA